MPMPSQLFQPERYQRSRPSSVVGSESPSIKPFDNKQQAKKIAVAISNFHAHGGSFKKRPGPTTVPVAPPCVPTTITSKDTTDNSIQRRDNNKSHSRTASDCDSNKQLPYRHWRNNSVDLASSSSTPPIESPVNVNLRTFGYNNVNNNKLTNTANASINAQTQNVYNVVNVNVNNDIKSHEQISSHQRPKCPPPPTPGATVCHTLTTSVDSNRLSNGQSVESDLSLPSIESEYDECAIRTVLAPVPPPRKVI